MHMSSRFITGLTIMAMFLFSSCSSSDSSPGSESLGSIIDVTDPGQSREVDIELNDENYAGTINSIYEDFDSYEGKTIHIHGFIFETKGNHFIGRNTKYSAINKYDTMLYLEYVLPEGTVYPELPAEGYAWYEIYGTLSRQSEGDNEYYFIRADDIRPASEGKATVG